MSARSLFPRLALCSIALAVLAACNKGSEPSALLPSEPAELTWARAALERNPQFEVLASDNQTRVFTVRNRATGQVETLNLNDLAAAPIAQLKAAAAPPPVVANVPAAPAPAVAQTPAASEKIAPEPVEPTATEQVASTNEPSGKVVGERNYTIDRSGGQLRVSGPGISIVSSGRGATNNSPNIAGTRTVEPIICEGKRMLKLDDRNIYVDGDAIIARGGCELYITNSRIIASGNGLVVDDAVVHIANSHIEGVSSSFNAGDRAKLYVRTSTFQGVPRRAEFASVLDQGGNQWN